MNIIDRVGMWDLFDEISDYPKGIAETGIPEEVLYCYVSSTLLNGFINYVGCIEAVMIERYGDEAEVTEYGGAVEDFNKTFHSNFSTLQDDVLIAAKSENFYWFFWYDKDCSDCVIGRFSKAKCSEDEYLVAFNNMISENDSFGDTTYKLKLSGWVKG